MDHWRIGERETSEGRSASLQYVASFAESRSAAADAGLFFHRHQPIRFQRLDPYDCQKHVRRIELHSDADRRVALHRGTDCAPGGGMVVGPHAGTTLAHGWQYVSGGTCGFCYSALALTGSA